MPAFHDTASFGKRQEYSVVAQLLRRGFDVYMTLVDDKGIDCIVRLDERRYVDVQIKARSKDAQQWNFFAAMNFKPRSNLFFIFYIERTDTFWTLPSTEVAKLSTQNRNGANAGRRALTLPKRDVGVVADRFAQFKNDAGFERLRGYVVQPADKTDKAVN